MDSSHGKQESPFEIGVSWLLGLNIALALAGYPLAGVMSAMLDLQSTATSYPYRAVSTALILLMATMVAFRGTFTVDPLLMLFFAAYGLRLFYDANYGGIPDAAFSGLFYVITVVIPFLGISIARGYFDERRAVVAMLVVCTPTIVYLLFAGLGGVGNSRLAETGRLSFDSLNAVSVGYVALYGLTAASFAIALTRPLWRAVFVAPFMAAAFLVLLLASARGAVVGGLLCLLAMSVRSGRVLIVGSITFIAIYLLFADQIMALPLVERLMNTGTDMSSLERYDRVLSSYEFMMNNLAFGYAYVETNYYSFPHNLLLESGLAMGMGGLVVMAMLQLRFIRLIWVALNEDGRFVAMLGIIGLSAAWLSTTLWGSVTFWIPLILLIAMASHERQIRRTLLFRRRNRGSRTTAGASGPTILSGGRRLRVPERRPDPVLPHGAATQTD
jgi:hypothetical protein